jgi:hypothetical protein
VAEIPHIQHCLMRGDGCDRGPLGSPMLHSIFVTHNSASNIRVFVNAVFRGVLLTVVVAALLDNANRALGCIAAQRRWQGLRVIGSTAACMHQGGPRTEQNVFQDAMVSSSA